MVSTSVRVSCLIPDYLAAFTLWVVDYFFQIHKFEQIMAPGSVKMVGPFPALGCFYTWRDWPLLRTHKCEQIMAIASIRMTDQFPAWRFLHLERLTTSTNHINLKTWSTCKYGVASPDIGGSHTWRGWLLPAKRMRSHIFNLN